MKRKNQRGIIGLFLLAALFLSFSPIFADDASDRVDKLLGPLEHPGFTRLRTGHHQRWQNHLQKRVWRSQYRIRCCH
jgi:hypothetical protein